jgi:hypothetical protein
VTAPPPTPRHPPASETRAGHSRDRTTPDPRSTRESTAESGLLRDRVLVNARIEPRDHRSIGRIGSGEIEAGDNSDARAANGQRGAESWFS